MSSAKEPNELDTLLKSLWRNWAFRLSLSSNELFHSNILQFLAEGADLQSEARDGDKNEADDRAEEDGGDAGEDDTGTGSGSSQKNARDSDGTLEPQFIGAAAALRFAKLFGPDVLECVRPIVKEARTRRALPRAFKVLREADHIDLTIQVPWTSKEYRPLLAVEVKVKSYPTAKQLEAYRDRLNAKWTHKANGANSNQEKSKPYFEPPLVLITGMGRGRIRAELDTPGDTAADVHRNPAAHVIDFGELRTALAGDAFQADRSPVRAEYIALCDGLHKLFTTLEAELTDELEWSRARLIGRKLERYRMHAIWWKLWADAQSQAVGKLLEEVPVRVSPPAFTRTGNFDAYWHWSESPEDAQPGARIKTGRAISIGLQVEGNSLRFFLNILDKELGSAFDSRLLVEAALLKLIRGHGVFARLPGLADLATYWNKMERQWRESGGEISFANRHVWMPSRDVPLPGDVDARIKATVGKGKIPRSGATGSRAPMLTGYANGEGNGFADLRVPITPDCTSAKFAELSRDVLMNNLFSRPNDLDTPVLQRVIRGFEESNSTLDWIAEPKLG